MIQLLIIPLLALIRVRLYVHRCNMMIRMLGDIQRTTLILHLHLQPFHLLTQLRNSPLQRLHFPFIRCNLLVQSLLLQVPPQHITTQLVVVPGNLLELVVEVGGVGGGLGELAGEGLVLLEQTVVLGFGDGVGSGEGERVGFGLDLVFDLGDLGGELEVGLFELGDGAMVLLVFNLNLGNTLQFESQPS